MKRWLGLAPWLLLLAACGARPYLTAINPLSANWQIEATPLENQRVHIALRMKPYYAGGGGEARALFQQHAAELAQLNEFDGYQVLTYSERLDSAILGSRRGAEGVVRLTKKSP